VSPPEGKKEFAFCPSGMGLPSYMFLEVRKPSEAISPSTRRNQGYSFCLMLNPTEFVGEEMKATETETGKEKQMR